MQLPTCTGIRIRSMADAHVIFHAVSLGLLPIVARRLDIDERRYIHSGCVCVWEERSASGEGSSATGIERWTDGRRWGPSRVRDEFLYYQEKLPEFEADEELSALINGSRLIKQTYSVFVDTPTGRRKWHLVAYFTGQTLESLLTIDDFPELAARTRTEPASLNLGLSLEPKAGLSSASLLARQPLYTIDGQNLPSPPRPPPAELHLPALKPEPWEPPRPPADELATRQPDLHCAQSRNLRRKHTIDLAPLIYIRKRPYPPRDVADDDILQRFDCGAIV
ncbi:Gti1/Pac2 family-domain-containing protein [Trametes maxima]|nr:Gti1/Pac2 family-domain-containing protein [Trametes maxima]